jgi:hypothetical protein
MDPYPNAAGVDDEREIMRAASIRFEKPSTRGRTAVVAAALGALLVAGYSQASLAQQPDTRAFRSAEEASNALYTAVRRKDEKAITAILGAGNELVSSNDKVRDRFDRERFAQKYQQMHRLVREPDASTVLYIGAENWPFPVPLVIESGAWHFDPKSGMEEVLFRRIGENELNATQACHALVLAQAEHRWPERDPSMRALRALLRTAPNHAGGPGVAFHGYYFRTLAGGAKDAAAGASSPAAFVAYPAVYGSSGVMTYVVDQDDVVYAKDLGANSASIAKGMTRYDPDSTWHPDE